MDTKLTLSFDTNAIEKGKAFAEKHNISLSRLTEFLYNQLSQGSYANLEDLPISDWVNLISEGEMEYKITPKSRKATRNEFLERN